ncbi:MAG: hypothetical protein ACLSUW_09135, partial [Akkermansia sp.]
RHAPQKTADLLNASGKSPFAVLPVIITTRNNILYICSIILSIHYDNITHISHERGHIFALTFGEKKAKFTRLAALFGNPVCKQPRSFMYNKPLTIA